MITLGIIGLVAAFTVPSLLNQTNEKELLTGFQTSYSILSQAYIRSAQENGTADTWGSAEDAYNYLKPYLRLQKDCSYTSPCIDYGKPVKDLQGNNSLTSYPYMLVLANGTTLNFMNDNGIIINVDVNGLKPPNKYGYDYFRVQLTTKNNAPFLSWHWFSTYARFCDKSYTGNEWAPGAACAYWIIKHGNMDYLHRSISQAEWDK